MMSAHVLVLYNEPVLAADHPDAIAEHDVVYTAEFVAGALTRAGFHVSRLGVGREVETLLDGLRTASPDVVFNLFEGTADHGQTEAYVAGVLEWLGLPFTGSPSRALSLARDKPLTKYLLQGAGLPTAPFFVIDRQPVPECPLEWPVFVKPAQQDASEGIDQGSVVATQTALEERVARLLAAYGPPVLVESYIPGRELAVALLTTPEVRALPVSEILFAPRDNAWPIVTYDAKWRAGTHDFEATPVSCPAEVSAELAERLVALGVRAVQLAGCRDYARVDFRVTAAGEPYILEVNPNPDFSPEAGLARGLHAGGLSHAAFTVQLVETALARGRRLQETRSVCP